jgi:DNA-binding transcriptional regulator GbsR (MarR family)
MAARSQLEEKHFIEDTGLFFEQLGMPRIAGRILGVLLIADPPAQSITDIVQVLKASKSAISIMSRFLLENGLIERVPSPMPRRDYYRFKTGGWIQYMKHWMELWSALHQITERGIGLLKDKASPDTDRLLEAHDLFSLMESQFPKILEKLQSERRARQQKKKTIS